ncbi:hypothetical protein L7F22_024113 [Adiantum nelumboides]|nr:hypothetical protein [Adiantum nelumboides]
MSVVRQWARQASGRTFRQLLVRWILACPQDAPEYLNYRLYRQGSIVGFERCTGYFLATFVRVSSARSVCSSMVCLRSMEKTENCLRVSLDTGSRVDDGISSIKVVKTAQVSPDIANLDVHGMVALQSVPCAVHDLCATDSDSGVLQVPNNEGMEVENGFPQTSVAVENNGSTRVNNQDSNAKLRRECTSFDKQELAVGFTCDDEEDDLQENLANISGSSKSGLLSKDSGRVQEICIFLDSKGWDVNVDEVLSKKYASCLSHSVVAMVIHRQKNLYVATSFFEWACKRLGYDSHSYHALLWKVGLNKQFDRVWELLDRMQVSGCQASETTFCIMIKCFGAAHNPDLAVAAFKRMDDYGVVAGTHTFTTLISVFFKLKLIHKVYLCYYKMIVDGMNLDMHLFSTLICGFGTFGKIRDAQACFDMMLHYNLEPNLSVFNSLIQGFCSCNARHNAVSTFHALQKRGLQPNSATYNAIIKAFCKDGKLEDAMSYFTDMRKRDNVQPNQATYNILLQGMFAKEEFFMAIEFFKQMERDGFVDPRSYVFLSSGLRQMKQTQGLLDMLTGLFELHGFSNTEVCNALIYNFSHLNALDEAAKIFRGMVNAQTHTSIPSYAVMISCYCRAHKLEEAIELLEELRERDCMPSSSCYNPIILLLVRESRASEALRYLLELQALGFETNQFVYDGLLKVLSKQSRIVDAAKICDVMMARKFTLSADTLFELMKCLTRLRGIEFATSCFRRMYEQEGLLDCKREVSQALAVMNLHSTE